MDDNNNFIIKGLAIILIAILGLNVYRTETTKKEMEQLTTTVDQMVTRLDSLGITEAPARVSPAVSGISKKEFTSLAKSVSALESKVSTLQSTIDKLSRSQAQSGGTSRISGSSSSGQTSSASSSAAATKPSSYSGRVSVSAKVKVENRYVNGTTYLPKVTSGPAGVVIINVTMDRFGIVGAVSVNSGSTITDEEILDQCKEAALRTSFGYNPDAPNKTTGTITYTFTAK